MKKNRISRKRKKQIVKAFGRETYRGIVGGYLKLNQSFSEGRRQMVTSVTGKSGSTYPYTAGQVLRATHLFHHKK